MAALTDAAIVGVGQTRVGAHPGKSWKSLAAEATRLALEDAGLAKSDIDGLVVIPSVVEPGIMPNIALCDYLGVRVRYSAQAGVAGANGCAALWQSALAIAHGLATTALVVGADNPLTGRPAGTVYASQDPWSGPYGSFAPGEYALVAQRHMHDYGTTEEQMAEVSATFRHHAALNPNAHMTEPISNEDVLSSPMIASPLRRLNCCPISDGGAAAILTRAERAADLPQPPVYIVGAGEGHTHEKVWHAPSLSTCQGARWSGETAFRMAGLRPKDVAVAEVYDCFSITPIVLLEDLGFCAKGEGGPFVSNGRVRLGGQLPLNTAGGLLSHGQPGMTGGFLLALEAVLQVRGQCGARQVPGVEFALAHGNGGILGTQCTLVLGRSRVL